MEVCNAVFTEASLSFSLAGVVPSLLKQMRAELRRINAVVIAVRGRYLSLGKNYRNYAVTQCVGGHDARLVAYISQRRRN